MMEFAYCPRRYCGARLECVDDTMRGVIALECPLCALNKRGRCRSPGCRGSLTNCRGMYCRPCSQRRRKASNNAAQLRRYHSNPAVKNRQLERNAERLRNDPAFRAARIAYKREYDKKSPWSATDLLYDRVYRERHPVTAAQRKRTNKRRRQRYKTDPAYRAKHLKRNRDRHAKKVQRQTVAAA